MKLGIMVDIESLALSPNAVVTQMAFVAFDREDPEADPIRVDEVYLPIDPQLALKREISGSTLLWWMKRDDKARARFDENNGTDMDELVALVGSFASKLANVIQGAEEYEVWARGPQFDIVNMETLMAVTGQQWPVKYSTVRDLRTLMALAGVSSADVPLRAGLVQHVALSDCKYQIDCYVEAMRRLHSTR